jgi:glyoxylase-like metal-dependent hydrolase (beta-lactamase superfamily II)/rhodanese-related sulfurtransferase
MSHQTDSTVPEAITTDELRALLEHHEPVTVLDIRPAEERAEWSIPGSIHVDAYEAIKAGDENALASLEIPDDRPVVTVCAAGRTSQIAAAQLRARGLDAKSLIDGMQGWSTAWNSAEIPLPTSDTGVVQIRRTGKGCLSYMIGSNGVVAVIDPSLDPEVYLNVASQYGWLITRVLETHIHADHLMRSRQLAERTGATLFVPDQKRVSYPFTPLHDGDIVDIGNAILRVIATPGHTLESTTFLLDNEALFTGDTLFLAGVGRPDLEADPEEARKRAHLLHRSLQELLALPPKTLVLPGHTSEPVSFNREPLRATLGDLVDRAPLLRASEDVFVTEILGRIPPTPPNHKRIIELNEAGAFSDEDAPGLEAGANRCAIA